MSILEKQLKEGLVYSMLPQYRYKVEKAQSDISKMFTLFPSSYVSVSWGKQSIVLAHLVFCVNKLATAVHFGGEDSEIISNFGVVKAQFLDKYPLHYIEIERKTRLRPAIYEFESKNTYNGVFIGLCAYESKGRNWTIHNSDKNSIFIMANGKARCTPLGEWTQDDLAAYIAVNKLPMLSTYHRYGLGARTSTGSREGSYTERAIDLLNSSNAAKLRDRWRNK